MQTEFTLYKFNSGMHYILLDDETVESLTKNGNKRAIGKLNNQIEFHYAIMPKKEGGYFINIGSNLCKKLNLTEGSTLTATFSIDQSTNQFEIPEEFQEVLITDPDADEIFHSLTEGNQRGLIYLISQVKSSEKKIERALKIADKLKNGITSPRIILK